MQIIRDLYGDTAFIVYRAYRVQGQRTGQAFMNALWRAGYEVDYNLLQTSGNDPFYHDGEHVVYDAIEYLTGV